MPESQSLIVEKSPTVWVATINRPTRRNALDNAAIAALARTVKDAEDTPGVVGLVIAGAGDRAFCAGSDLKAIAEMSSSEQIKHVAVGQELMNTIESSRLLTVAAVTGYALGGGFELALACDLIVTSHDATFGLPEVQSGMISAWGGTFRLARAIGLARARAIILGGVQLSGDDAVTNGVALTAVAGDAVAKEASSLVMRIAESSSAAAISTSKNLLIHGMSLETAAASNGELVAELQMSHSSGYGQKKP